MRDPRLDPYDGPSGCPASALGVSVCVQLLKDRSASDAEANGERCEITVSTAPPLIQGPYELAGFECPHGVTYWIEPTSEQIADWAARRVR